MFPTSPGTSTLPSQVHPPRGTKAWEEQKEPPKPQGQHCVLKGTTATFPLLCLAPLRETALDLLQWVPLIPSPLWDAPTSSAADHSGLSIWDCCRRCHGRKSIHAAWPCSPGSHIPHISPQTVLGMQGRCWQAATALSKTTDIWPQSAGA